MLIRSTHKPKSVQKAANQEAKASDTNTEENSTPVDKIYSGGSWEFDFGNNVTTYRLDQARAVNLMQSRGDNDSGDATYTIFGPSGPYKSLPKSEQKKRKDLAKAEAIGKGIGATICGGILIGGGAVVMDVLGSIGSILSRSGGGSSVAIGLGTIAALSGLAGLTVGLLSYKEGLESPFPETVHSGRARTTGDGFQFTPYSDSPDQRQIMVKKDSLTEVKPK